MCGIISYSGKQNCSPILIDGLKALEYRGYDSAGICLSKGKDNKSKFKTIKTKGKVELLNNLVIKDKDKYTTGIGHTRWATHGSACSVNAHPHSSSDNDISIVHNGIIENYQELKKELQNKGFVFKSQTDSEVIANLLSFYIKDSKVDISLKNDLELQKYFINIIAKANVKLKGSYAISILWNKLPQNIFGLKNHSPLVIGIGENENFLASDILAFLKHTKKTIFLDDNQIVNMSNTQVQIYNSKLHKVKLNIKEVKNSATDIGKDGYDHFMLKEIHQQVQTTKDTLSNALEVINADNFKKHFNFKLSELKDIDYIEIVACGTAYHAGFASKYFIEEITDIPVFVDMASEYRYKKSNKHKGRALTIAVSQSGETADTISAIKKAKQLGSKTLAIINVVNSTLSRICDSTFYTKCLSEISVASTKVFTGQLSAIYIFAIYLSFCKGTLNKNQIAKLAKEIKTIPNVVKDALKQEKQIQKIAKKLYKRKTFVFIGRLFNYPIAMEGALKLKEISYTQAEAFAGGELKHGPIAIITKDTVIIALCPAGMVYEKMISTCSEVKARKGFILALSDKRANSNFDELVKLKSSSEYLSVFSNSIVLQLFAYYVAKYNGCEIDQPRNLAKSVTVE